MIFHELQVLQILTVLVSLTCEQPLQIIFMVKVNIQVQS